MRKANISNFECSLTGYIFINSNNIRDRAEQNFVDIANYLPDGKEKSSQEKEEGKEEEGVCLQLSSPS